jgi:hypothetical protein
MKKVFGDWKCTKCGHKYSYHYKYTYDITTQCRIQGCKCDDFEDNPEKKKEK